MAAVRPSNELVQFLSQVLPTPVDAGKVADFKRKAVDYDATQREIFDDLATGFGEAIESVAAGTVRVLRDVQEAGAQYAWKTMADLRSRIGGLGIRELHIPYESWRARRNQANSEAWRKHLEEDLRQYHAELRDYKAGRRPDEPVRPDPPEDLSPEAYEKACTHGRPRAIFDALLGPNAQGAPRGVAESGPSQASDRWTWVQDRLFARRLDKDFAKETVAEVNSLSKLTENVNWIRNQLSNPRLVAGARDRANESIVFIANVLLRHAKKSDAWIDDLDELNRLLAEVDEAAIKSILGNRELGWEELLARLLEAEQILQDTFETVGVGDGLQAVASQFWQIKGIHAIVHECVRRSGYQHGYVFEVAVVVQWFVDAASDLSDVVMQVSIAGSHGPDIVRLIGTNLARLVQAKSWKDLNALTGWNGEVVRQLGSDLRRIWTENGRQLRLEIEKGVFRDVDSLFEYKVDWHRLSISKTNETLKTEIIAWARSRIPSVNLPGDQVDKLLKGEQMLVLDGVAMSRNQVLRDMTRDNVQAQTDLINRLLVDDTPIANNPQFRDEILSTAAAVGKEAQRKMDDADKVDLRGVLQARLDANPDMTVRELALSFLVMHRRTGTIGDQGDHLLRHLLERDPPVRLDVEIMETAVMWGS